MSRWPNRIFAVFSMVWGLLILGCLTFAWMARNYMLSTETGWLQALLECAAILGVGALIWVGAFRLMRWFEERN